MASFEPHSLTLTYTTNLTETSVQAEAKTTVFFLDPVGSEYKMPRVCRTTLGSISTEPFTITVDNPDNKTYHQLQLCFALDKELGSSLFVDAIASGSQVKVNLIVTVIGLVGGVPTILAGDSLQLTLIKKLP